MSLINDMLKNLEKNVQPKPIPSYFIDLKPTLSAEWKENKKYYAVITLLSIIFVFCAIGFMYLHLTNKHAPISQPAIPVFNKFQPQRVMSTDVQTGMTLLTGIALHTQNEVTGLRFLLNQDTLYQLSSDNSKNELSIILEHTHLVAALPRVNYAGSAIKNIEAFFDENNNLKLVLQLNANAEIKRLEINDHGKSPELQIEILDHEDVLAENEVKSPSVTPMAKPILESVPQQQYWHAQQLLTLGKNDEATKVLQDLLTSSPTQIPARLLLAKLLLQQNDLVAASKILDVGLQQQPTNLMFIELKARLLVKENKITHAIRWLEGEAPPLVENPEYHAFIAALYQREGKAMIAADIYKQLLTVQPSNAKWWLGLGIALDAMGGHSQALEAYARANQSKNLNPELKAYLDSRLATRV